MLEGLNDFRPHTTEEVPKNVLNQKLRVTSGGRKFREHSMAKKMTRDAHTSGNNHGSI